MQTSSQLLSLVKRVAILGLLISTTTGVARSDEPPASAPSINRPTVAVIQARDTVVPAPHLVQLLQQRLSNVGFSVVDISNRQSVLQEQAIAADGQVTPATRASLGRMLGVNYLAVVRIDKLSVTSEQRVGIVSLLSSTPTYVTKVALDDRLSFVDVKSGEIIQSVEDARDVSSPPSQAQNQGFVETAASKLVIASAEALIAKIDATRFTKGAPVTSINGRVLDVSGSTVTISLGAATGVSVGQIVDFYDSKTLLNPDTNKPLETMIKRGSIQIIQVEREYSIGSVLPASPKPVKLQLVRLGAP